MRANLPGVDADVALRGKGSVGRHCCFFKTNGQMDKTIMCMYFRGCICLN